MKHHNFGGYVVNPRNGAVFLTRAEGRKFAFQYSLLSLLTFSPISVFALFSSGFFRTEDLISTFIVGGFSWLGISMLAYIAIYLIGTRFGMAVRDYE